MMAKQGRVYTAQPLPQEEQQSIHDRFSSMLGGDLVLDFQVDESLIGGMLALIDGRAYDTSIKSQLEQARHYMLSERE